jgi:hypothetical protein
MCSNAYNVSSWVGFRQLYFKVHVNSTAGGLITPKLVANLSDPQNFQLDQAPQSVFMAGCLSNSSLWPAKVKSVTHAFQTQFNHLNSLIPFNCVISSDLGATSMTPTSIQCFKLPYPSAFSAIVADHFEQVEHLTFDFLTLSRNTNFDVIWSYHTSCRGQTIVRRPIRFDFSIRCGKGRFFLQLSHFFQLM